MLVSSQHNSDSDHCWIPSSLSLALPPSQLRSTLGGGLRPSAALLERQTLAGCEYAALVTTTEVLTPRCGTQGVLKCCFFFSVFCNIACFLLAARLEAWPHFLLA